MIDFRTYIGVKQLEATPMTRGDYNLYRGWHIPEDEKSSDPGYLVKYSDDYQSWSPADVFDKAYMEIENPSTISQTDLDRFVGVDAFEAMQLDEKTFCMKCTPRTGFVMFETSSCVDPENYDQEIAAQITGEKVQNKLWGFMGFVLQWARFGLKSGNPPVEKAE